MPLVSIMYFDLNLLFLAVTVFFEKSSYTFDKSPTQPSIFLQLSKPLKADVAVTILDKEGTATSESLN